MWEFQNNHGREFVAADARGWIGDLRPHLIEDRPSWTRESLPEETARYQTRSAFAAGCTGADVAARSQGRLDYICAHMSDG